MSRLIRRGDAGYEQARVGRLFNDRTRTAIRRPSCSLRTPPTWRPVCGWPARKGYR